VLHVDDLIRAYEAAIEHPEVVGGQAFNIGGGKENTLSLLELLEILRCEVRVDLPIRFDAWRPGDQRVFVSDITKAKRMLAWEPQIGAKPGISSLFRWIRANRACLDALFPRQ
jgi:CDP-paratose 2-epimerase